MIKAYKNLYYSLATILPALTLLTISTLSYADEKVVDILPPTTQTSQEDSSMIAGEQTHPALHLTPDKSELIRLDEDANSVIIGNPTHINVIVDSPRTLVIVPRAPGATHFIVLDKNGQILMQRHAIVASPAKGYIKIKRTCSEDARNCQNTSIFYCPDACHEIGLDIKAGATTSYTASPASNDKKIPAPDNMNSDNEHVEESE